MFFPWFSHGFFTVRTNVMASSDALPGRRARTAAPWLRDGRPAVESRAALVAMG